MEWTKLDCLIGIWWDEMVGVEDMGWFEHICTQVDLSSDWKAASAHLPRQTRLSDWKIASIAPNNHLQIGAFRVLLWSVILSF
jgi:hypothetical protein